MITLESVKTSADLYAPKSGTIETVNEKLAEAPEGLTDPESEEGWMIKMKTDSDDFDDLMDQEQYDKYKEEDMES
eukprot:CAMPEP_0176365092 /NCGR_PEP_ID=MMETSP0126-20121128/20227_1 /TAXON_ID=141414 ORGANISM="Strombidinopsis acuminatum, Strain SPMC142" /NCGR_SAMPLE_ID=MMETSP0126 /ASSEMBLY_ACC=CAM_ASM_000229 /LENGTH=74 /DNA_ID=CAMNT_0017721953 /DNA_START=355 /DNA_END=579 /DNA_ORIENTATION=+